MSHAVSAAHSHSHTHAAKAPSVHPNVRVGSRGAHVAALQRLLNARGAKLAVDGQFGPKTRAAVLAFQRRSKIDVDGIVGPITWGKLGQKGSGKSGGTSAANGGAPISGGAVGPGKKVTAYVNGSPRTITVVPVGNGQYMRADAGSSFRAMQEAARKAGIHLSATSGFRTMDQQKALYAKYLNGTGNLAAKPGYSNHQNGISMDIGGINGYGTKAYAWLKANAGKYGYVNDVPGEYWHFTYKG